MSNSNKIQRLSFLLLLAGPMLLMPAAAQQSEQAEVSARDVFKSARNRFYIQNPQARPKATAQAKPPSRPATPPSRPTRPVEVPDEQPVEVAQERPAERPQNRPQSKPTQPAAERPNLPDDESVALLLPVSDEPLGLRYSLLKKTPDGSAEEVDVDSVFRSGDSIRLKVESSDVAYLYLLTKGSSGQWQVLFPSPAIAGGAHRIRPDGDYVVPPTGWFTFDETAGEERIFVVLSRQKIANLEQLIYELRSKPAGGQPGPAPAPRQDPVVLAELREVRTRDLVFEKVNDEEAPAGAAPGEAEKAAYVVTKEGGHDARVVAEFTLEHR